MYTGRRYILLLLAMILFSINVGCSGPKDYDECVLESLKGVTNKQLAGAIIRSCRAKFPLEEKEEIKTKPSKEEAINLVKKSYVFSNGKRTDHELERMLEKTKGELKIIGWKAEKIDDQIFLVSYTND